jgi:dipeptidyl aminopeptidase/acylaminoacyl peptidase
VPADEADVAALASPLYQVDVGTPPTLLLHGREDVVVDPAQAERSHRELSTVTDAEIELLAGEGADHDFPVSAHTVDETVELTASFGDRHLGV